jgi:hypothetical protein
MVFKSEEFNFVKNEIYQKGERKREKDRYQPVNDTKQQNSRVALLEQKTTP